MDILISYLHLLSIMTLMGTLITEHLLLKPDLDKQQINRLALIDLVYVLSAVIALGTGLLRWFVYGKGSFFYLSNPIFHAKLTLFVVLIILSIIPSLQYIKWKNQARNGEIPGALAGSVKKLLFFIRLELLIVAVIPLLAVMVARGFRF
jgi:putative membrane protein